MTSPDAAIRAALDATGLPALKVVADPGDIAALERAPGCKLSFPAALQRALEAFLTDGRGSEGGHDSALDIVRSAPESFGLGPQPTSPEIAEALRKMLAEDPGAEIVLLGPKTVGEATYQFLPEFGESIEEHWVFRIIAPAGWPFLQWSIVDPGGERPAYSYGFD